MLSQIRGALKGIVAWIVVVLLVLAFALFGAPDMAQLLNNPALKVGDQNYSSAYLRSELAREINLLARERQAQGQPGLTREEAIATGVLDQYIARLVTQSTLKQAAENMGLAVPNELVRDYLNNEENFKNPITGKVDPAGLAQLLQNNGLSPAEFERRVTEDLLRGQLARAVLNSAPAPKAITDITVMYQTERRKVSYLTVTQDMAGIAAEPTPDDLKAYYTENSAKYQAPEYRSFEMLVLRDADFADVATASDEDLRKLYEARKSREYVTPETRTIYQLTVSDETKAGAAHAALKAGQPFAAIAQQNGYSLAELTLTKIAPTAIADESVRNVAFGASVKPGDVVEPIKSLFGYTIIQVAEIQPGKSISFAQVRDELAKEYDSRGNRRALIDAVDKIELARDEGASLADAASELGLEIVSVGPIDRHSFEPGGAVIDAIPGAVIREAFLLEPGDESEALQLDGNDEGFFFLSVKDVIDPTLKEYALVEDEVARAWRAEERRGRITNTREGIMKSLSDEGKSLNEVAESFSRAPVVKIINRSDADEVISGPLNADIFDAELNSFVWGNAGLGEAQIIAQVQEIGFARSSFTPELEQNYAQSLGYQLDQEMLDAYIGVLRDDLNVRIDERQIETIKADS